MPEAQRLRVVTLTDTLGLGGGAETLAVEIVRRLDPERFHRTICATRLKGGPEERAGMNRALEELRMSGVEIVSLERASRVQVWSWRPLVQRMRGGLVDVLHSHKHGSNVWATALGRIAPVPVVIAHEHTWSFTGDPLRKLLDRRLIATGCDALLAVSREDRRRMIEVERIPPERIRLVQNGIPRPVVASDADVRARLGIPADSPVVGSIGILRPQKRYDELLRAFEIVRSRLPDAHLVIAGDGPERAGLEALVASLDLAGAVHLLGLRSDVAAVISAFDVAVSSSAYEGSSLSIMEYMSLARPIVATAVGGTPDLIQDGRDGVLVAPHDPAALAQATIGLLLDRERAAALGASALARQRAEFDIDITVERIAALYEELYARATGGEPRRRPEPAGVSG